MRRRLDLLAEHRVRLPRDEALSELPEDIVRSRLRGGRLRAHRGPAAGLLLRQVPLRDQARHSAAVWSFPGGPRVARHLSVAALERRERFRVLWSGATHDAAHVARVAPTGLLFVLSREGLSHTPEEWSRVDDIACGTEVMAAALVALDEEAK